jgi:hypothetical protein
MSVYTPFLIGNQRIGLELDLDPWLLPGDAYPSIDNFTLFQGRITKRAGYASFGTLSNQPVMGLFNYRDSQGNTALVGMNTKRFFKYSAGSFSDLSGSDTYTGDDSHFFQAINWLNNMYFVNGTDAVGKFNGSAVSTLSIDPGGIAGHNVVTGVVYVVPYHDKLVILNPVENGTRYPQRARWSDTGTPGTWSTQNYIDAPTQDNIRSACFLHDELYVFFDYSTWVLRYLGDPQLPFYWHRVDDSTGIIGTRAVMAFKSKAYGLSSTRIITCTESGVQFLDKAIPRMILNMNQNALRYCYVISNEIEDQIWFAYPSVNSSGNCDKILVLNYSDLSWSTFSLPSMCFGFFNQPSTPTWDDRYRTWDSIETRWDDPSFNQGYPQILIGKSDGTVVAFGSTNLDGASVVTASLKSSRLSPFLKQGRRTQLGWIDLLVDTHVGSTMSFNLYSDGQSNPYVSLTGIPLDDGNGNEKSWIRIPSGCDAEFHQFGITHDTAGPMTLHAVVPWFKAGGRIYG